MDQIKINRNGEEFGPYAPQQVAEMAKSGRLVATDLAWWEGMPEWQPLGALPAFSGLFAAPGGAQAEAQAPAGAGAGQPMVTVDRNGTRFGPFPLAEVEGLIAAGRLAPSDMMWTEGMTGWMPLGSHPEFGARFAAQAPAGQGPAAAAGESNATQRYLAELEKRKQGKGRRKAEGAARTQAPTDPVPSGKRRGLVVSVVGVVLLGLLWAGATVFFGSAAAAFFREEVADLGTQAGVLRLEGGEFNRGFLSSETTTSLSAANSPLDGSLQVKHRVYHGPLAFTPDGLKLAANYIVTTLDLSTGDPAARQRIEQAFGGAEPMTLTTSVGLGGGTMMKLTVPPCEFEPPAGDGPGGSLLKFAGIEGAMSSRGEQAEGSVEIGAVEYEGGGGALRVKIAAGSISADAREIQDEVMVDGLVSYKFPQVAVELEGESIVVDHITIDLESTHEDGKMGSRTTFAVRAVELPQDESLDDLRKIVGSGGRIEFGFRGVDSKALRAVLDALESIEQSVAAGDMIDPEAPVGPAGDVEQLAQQFTALVQRGTGFWFNSQIGSTRFDLDLEYTGAGSLADMEDPEALLSSVEGALDLRIDKAILPDEAAGGFFAGMVEQGVLVDRPASYESSITVGGGQLTLNGEPADLEQLLAPPPPPEFDLEGLEGLEGLDLEGLEEMMQEEVN